MIGEINIKEGTVQVIKSFDDVPIDYEIQELQKAKVAHQDAISLIDEQLKKLDNAGVDVDKISADVKVSPVETPEFLKP